MAVIYAIRHGQANTANSDYDKLTPLGVTQIQTLAKYFVTQGIKISFIGSGTIQRQQQSALEFISTYKSNGLNLPQLVQLPGLNELEEIVWKRVGKNLFFRKISFVKAFLKWKTSLVFKRKNIETNFFDVILIILSHWISNDYTAPQVESFLAFKEKVIATFRNLPIESNGNILLFTSGMPIYCFLKHCQNKDKLSLDEKFPDLKNASITTFKYNEKQLNLVKMGEVVA